MSFIFGADQYRLFSVLFRWSVTPRRKRINNKELSLACQNYQQSITNTVCQLINKYSFHSDLKGGTDLSGGHGECVFPINKSGEEERALSVSIRGDIDQTDACRKD